MPPCRYSAHSGVRNRGEPDFGMLEFMCLDEIKEACSKARFTDPLPEYQSLAKTADTKSESHDEPQSIEQDTAAIGAMPSSC